MLYVSLTSAYSRSKVFSSWVGQLTYLKVQCPWIKSTIHRVNSHCFLILPLRLTPFYNVANQRSILVALHMKRPSFLESA